MLANAVDRSSSASATVWSRTPDADIAGFDDESEDGLKEDENDISEDVESDPMVVSALRATAAADNITCSMSAKVELSR